MQDKKTPLSAEQIDEIMICSENAKLKYIARNIYDNNRDSHDLHTRLDPEDICFIDGYIEALKDCGA